MSNEFQQQLEDLKQRMDALEKAEIKLRIQSVGPRGPQGPPGPLGIEGEKGVSVRGDTGRNGANGRDGRNGEVDYNEVETRLIHILIDYGLIDEILGPLKRFVQLYPLVATETTLESKDERAQEKSRKACAALPVPTEEKPNN